MKLNSILFILLATSIISCNATGQSSSANQPATTAEAANLKQATTSTAIQKQIDPLAALSDAPEQAIKFNWHEKALDYNAIIFNQASGQFLPLAKMDPDGTLALPSYVGDFRTKAGSQEAINVFAALLSGSLVGIDESRYLDQIDGFFNPEQGVFTNNVHGSAGNSFWYDLYPNILYAKLALHHPKNQLLQQRFLTIAQSWKNVGNWLLKQQNLNYTAFDFKTNQGVVKDWVEPDVAIGIAYLELLAYQKFHDQAYLDSAKALMTLVDKYPGNPYYEVLSAYGPYVAATLNANYGTNYDVNKYLNWLLDGDSTARNGWGIMRAKWGSYDVSGLVGTSVDNGGYAFTMNTFAIAEAISAVPRYDLRYANNLGKWLYNIATNSVLFYRDGIPAEHQKSVTWDEDTRFAIPYEGLRHEENSITPIATGDAVKFKWAATDYSLYSGSYVGMLGDFVSATNNPHVLRFDLNANDYFSQHQYPLYWYYNAAANATKINLNLAQPSDIYDLLAKHYIRKNADGKQNVIVPANSSLILAILPINSKVEYENGKLVNHGEFMAADKGLALNVTVPTTAVVWSSTVNLTLQALSNAKIKQLQIIIDGNQVYASNFMPQYALDTTKLSNGTHSIKFVVHDTQGQEDSVQRKFITYNPGASGNILSLHNDYADLQINPIDVMPGVASYAKKQLTVRENNPEGGWGGVKIAIDSFDFDQDALLLVDVNSANKSWGMKIELQDDPENKWGYYIQGDSSKIGSQIIDVQKALHSYNPKIQLTGTHPIQLWLYAVGDKGANVVFNDLDLFYLTTK